MTGLIAEPFVSGESRSFNRRFLTPRRNLLHSVA